MAGFGACLGLGSTAVYEFLYLVRTTRCKSFFSGAFNDVKQTAIDDQSKMITIACSRRSVIRAIVLTVVLMLPLARSFVETAAKPVHVL